MTTDADLGTISSNYISTKNITATTTVPKARLLFTLVSGELPPGLNLSFDGEIIGKINSFGTPTAPGLTVFDNNNFQLDGNTTFLDREFKFTARVQDHLLVTVQLLENLQLKLQIRMINYIATCLCNRS